jgi:hypothetical protein
MRRESFTRHTSEWESKDSTGVARRIVFHNDHGIVEANEKRRETFRGGTGMVMAEEEAQAGHDQAGKVAHGEVRDTQELADRDVGNRSSGSTSVSCHDVGGRQLRSEVEAYDSPIRVE